MGMQTPIQGDQLGYEDTGDESEWISASELSHAADLVSNFHIAYSAKPSPLPLS